MDSCIVCNQIVVLVKRPSFAMDVNVGNTIPAKLASASKTTVEQQFWQINQLAL